LIVVQRRKPHGWTPLVRAEALPERVEAPAGLARRLSLPYAGMTRIDPAPLRRGRLTDHHEPPLLLESLPEPPPDESLLDEPHDRESSLDESHDDDLLLDEYDQSSEGSSEESSEESELHWMLPLSKLRTILMMTHMTTTTIITMIAMVIRLLISRHISADSKRLSVSVTPLVTSSLRSAGLSALVRMSVSASFVRALLQFFPARSSAYRGS